MFSLFKKKPAGKKITDLVFAKQQGKWHALERALSASPAPVLVAWFDDSMDALNTYLEQHGKPAAVISYRQLHGGIIGNQPLIFIEHYPLAEKETRLFETLPNTITVYSSLDEAFFSHFGGDRITHVLQQLGLDENEAISHSMITSSIRRAQEKLAERVTMEQSAHSMEEWMRKNSGT